MKSSKVNAEEFRAKIKDLLHFMSVSACASENKHRAIMYKSLGASIDELYKALEKEALDKESPTNATEFDNLLEHALALYRTNSKASVCTLNPASKSPAEVKY